MLINSLEDYYNEGLVLNLDPLLNSGSTSTWNDLSGNNNNVTFSQVTFSGSSYEYNGSTSTGFITYSSSLNLTASTKFSIDAWIYLKGESLSGEDAQILTQDDGSSSPLNWQFRVRDNTKKLQFIYQTGTLRSTAVVDFISSNALELNKWYYVAVTYNQPTLSLYINDKLEATRSAPTINSINSDTGLGCFNLGGYGNNLNGFLGSVRAYKGYYLDSEKIMRNYLTQRGRYNRDTILMSGISLRLKEPIVTEGLVLYLDASNERSYPESGTTWFDLSGNRNHSTLVNGPSYDSSYGGSIVFDGVDDYVVTPITTTYQNFTLSCWFYNTSSSKSSRSLISKNSYFAVSTTDFPVNLGLTSDGTQVYIRISSGTSFYITTPETGSTLLSNLSSLNTWYHVTATYDKVNLNLYVNGVLVNTTPNNISLPNNTRPFTIGRAAAEATGGIDDSQYNGNISQVCIYDRALAATEIQQNYENQKERFS